MWISGHLFVSTALSSLIFHMIPASTGLSEYAKYAVGGFIANGVLDKVLFIFGQQIGTKIEVPQIAPPPVLAPTATAPSQSQPSQGGTAK